MKFKSLLLFSLCLFSSKAFSQSASPDSLNRKAISIRTYDPDNSFRFAALALDKATQLNDSSQMAFSLKNMGVALYFASQFDSAAIFLKKSYKIYLAINDSVGMSAAALNLGNVFKQTASMKDAEKCYLISLNIDHALHDTAGMAFGLNNIAQLYQFRGEYPQAIEIYKQSAEFNLAAGDQFGAAQAWINTGVVYQETKNFEESNRFLYKALAYFRTIDDPMHIAISLLNLGDNCRFKKEFDKSKKYLNEAMSLSKNNELMSELATSYLYYSYLLDDLNQSDSASWYFYKSMDLCVETGNDFLASHALLQRGRMLAEQHQYEQSNECLLNAYDFARTLEYNTTLAQILNLLSDNYSALGDYEAAWKYRQLASENALILSQNSEPVKDVDETQQDKDSSNKSEKSNDSDRQSLIYGVLAGITFVSLLLALFLFIKSRTTKK